MKIDEIIAILARSVGKAPGFVTIPAAARQFGASVSRMKKTIATGAVPVVRVGRSIRVDISHLRELL
jgi:hypothetical protein